MALGDLIHSVDEFVPTKALVIVAHPDDVDFGAAGTVATLTDHGVEVVYGLVTSGQAGEPAEKATAGTDDPVGYRPRSPNAQAARKTRDLVQSIGDEKQANREAQHIRRGDAERPDAQRNTDQAA